LVGGRWLVRRTGRRLGGGFGTRGEEKNLLTRRGGLQPGRICRERCTPPAETAKENPELGEGNDPV